MSENIGRRDVPPLTRPEQALMGLAAVAAAGVGALGFASSFSAVSEAAARWDFAAPWMLPIGIDIAIPVFTVAHLLLVRMDMALAWVRFVPWVLTGVTCWLNIAAGTSVSAKVAHGTMPLLWVVFSEIIAHVYAVRIGAVTGKRMEKIRRSRWLLAFPSTFALWRRMTLWEITSYGDALARERERQLARADLRERHGRRWRSKTPRRERVLLKLGELTPTTPVTDQDETPRSTVNQSGSDLRESTPTLEAPTAGLPAAESAEPAPAVESLPTAGPAPVVESTGPMESADETAVVEPAVPAESAPVKPVAVAAPARRRATGRVPQSARTSRPVRTREQLLTEARTATAGWQESELTGEAIRKAVRTSSANGRILRDALRIERGTADTAAEATAA
ncbi:DUF2637 domain-containing protein [Streptomyces paludis]|uniref:DUF2637 domain-containing protein n=1 Tax=Streptomyces paludis TaxID=2282738 RepID=A0A345HSJ1_9ACTN|nr:DUF2637 domain-containing protein [Streptomyces paludis]AXG79665.1 DUF2637 domain-containing protein [Streptomyces paludis]